MTGKRYRVVHCGTGATGRFGIPGVVHHPDLDLVGHLVFDPAKEGKDAGEFCSPGPDLGITATQDIDALIALKPDCLCFFGDGLGHLQDSLAVICRFLQAGVNVATASLYELSYPASAPGETRQLVEKACANGNSTFYNGGYDPGTAVPWMPTALLKMADEITQIRMQEISNYAVYNVEWIMRDVYGFGKPADYRGLLADGSVFKQSFIGSVNAVASRMGIALEDWRVFFENCTHDNTHETTWGTVEAGTVAAVRFGVEGVYKGKPFIILEHVNRSTLDAAPHWPQPRWEEGSKMQHQHVGIIEGEPHLECRIDSGVPTRDGSDGGLVATAMVIVNAVPVVVEHAPGLVDEMDLPLYAARNVRV
jgi:4-hydroxy-tetrahydrodipicolinate reductase